MYNSIVGAVLKHSVQSPNCLAIADEKTSYTYGQLASLLKRAVYYLKKIGGVQSCNDRVIVECTQDTKFIIIDLALQYLGAIFVPIEKEAAISRVQELYKELSATCIIGKQDYTAAGKYYDIERIWENIQRESEEYDNIEENDIAEILFSTGTTGKPKGIVISNKANVAIAQNISDGVQMKSNTVELIPLPLSHSHGLRTCYANLLNGSAVIIIDGVMNMKLFFDVIERYSVNALDLSPTLAILLLKIARRGLHKIADTIDYIEIGTATLGDNIKRELKEIFLHTRLYNFYGATEAGRSCVLEFNQFDKTGCIGKPSINAELFIVDEDRKIIKSSKDNMGLIAVSGDMMMEGYFNDLLLTQSTLVDGVLYTNDVGYIDENGYVYVIGRQGDVINYKGIKIAPEEIETVVQKYEGIEDCACIPERDSICGQIPKLFIQIEKGKCVDVELLNEYLRAHLEMSRMPRHIQVIDKIPRTENGKILRRELKSEQENL